MRRDEIEAAELLALGNGGDGLDTVSCEQERWQGESATRTIAMVMCVVGRLGALVMLQQHLAAGAQTEAQVKAT